MPYPKTAIVIGGSIAGLLQGLQLKRNGVNVTVLEQDPSDDRHSHESGVQIGPSVVSLFDKYDATGRPSAIPARFLSVAWRKHLRIINHPAPRHMSNWGTLYLILRANFDGKTSEMVPDAPPPRKGDGEVAYRPGKRAMGLRYSKDEGIVHVEFEDVKTGEKDTISAETVIAADGVHSTVRKILHVPSEKKYSGYIGWRGTVPERLLSPETVEYFSNRLNFSLMNGTYCISYIIPTETGHVEPGKRLLNWVWYYPAADGSREMTDIFTDTNGKIHPSTVPQGLVKPDVWASQKARHLEQMIPPLAEIIDKTPRPFISKVADLDGTDHQASFFDGRLVLVGDAYNAFRSHLGMASEQAARHCWQMDRVWRGEITQQERDREAALYAKRFILLNRFIGLTGMELWFQLFKTVAGYAWLMLMHFMGFV
ncbi:uncharacterized protein B0H64DRAFT_355857 [Chaetomium fimeti]|uniref:2,6-dihydroxypyridine 3-monooxygenase substrate binding domain-containing protein n=1 Tax=Chaetomium fimeti TaxID=1854472 RepID=A0AAE0HN51_9PEZI|nr:hypothetical protein B0H64DRAFT_355857 [Chaetomium fimeti]